MPRRRTCPTARPTAITITRLHHVKPTRAEKATATSTPATTLTTRWSALRIVWYMVACTMSSAVSGASTGCGLTGSCSATREANAAVTVSRAMYAAGGWARRRTRVRVAGAVWTTARTVVPTGLSGSRARTVPGRAGEEGVAGAEGAAGADGPLARRLGIGGSFSRRGPRPSLAIKAAFLTGSPKPR